MNLFLIPIAGIMFVVMMYFLLQIPKKENHSERILKALIILLFIAVFAVICYYIPAQKLSD